MAVVSVPSENNIIFQRYFECVWNMEANDNWADNYSRMTLIEEIMVACGYDPMASFLMLSRSHDIIYDREYSQTQEAGG